MSLQLRSRVLSSLDKNLNWGILKYKYKYSLNKTFKSDCILKNKIQIQREQDFWIGQHPHIFCWIIIIIMIHHHHHHNHSHHHHHHHYHNHNHHHHDHYLEEVGIAKGRRETKNEISLWMLWDWLQDGTWNTLLFSFSMYLYLYLHL